MAGTGKTILSTQICFNLVRTGQKALYLTLIAESHTKLLRHLEGMAFFDAKAVSSASLILLSGYDKLVADGLDGLLELIANSIRSHRPSLMVVDGFRSARDISESDLKLAHFIHQLNTLITSTTCTTLLLAPLSGNSPQPEHTLVDGLIELNRYASGMRRAREIEVHKMRASDHLLGRHTLTITQAGIIVYPRLEAQQTRYTPEPSEISARRPFGIERLDAMIQGGLTAGSTTLLLGAPGTGKTLLGLNFLDHGVRNGERSLYFGFYESPDRLLGKASALGMTLARAAERGLFEIIWQPPLEHSLDILGEKLLAAVRRNNVSRLMIDGIEGFRDTSMYPERASRFMAALTNALKALNVTTLIAEELPLYSYLLEQKGFNVSAVIENIVLLRYVEIRSQLYRLISVMKLRESSHDTAIREFTVSSKGIAVAASFTSAEQILKGGGELLSASTEARLNAGDRGGADPTT